MAAVSDPTDMLPKLEEVRRVCLSDSSQYSQVVPSIVPILSASSVVDVRRWGADFIAEVFATPALPPHQKEQLISDQVMGMLRGMLELPHEDVAVVKSAVQTCASIYPYVFRRVIAHPESAIIWRDMATIKLNILQRIDSAPLPIRICCIKFLQKVVQVQTPGVIADPRRPDQNETSLALVPRNHPLLPLANLEAETSGILDRLLSAIQENSTDPLLVDPTMNCLAVLIKTRPAIQAKILQTILNYNPLRAASGPMTPKMTVVIKSLQRTTRALLRYVLRLLPQHPLAEKVNSYLQRLQSSTTAVFTQAHAQKRPLEAGGPEDAKRQKIEQPKRFPPMPPSPNTYAQLFTLIENQEFQQFDVKLLPEDMVCLISSALMQHIDSKSLDEAIEEVQQRLQVIQDAAKKLPAPGTGVEDDDDYDPEALAGSGNAVASQAQAAADLLPQPTLELGPFELPKPLPLSYTELAMLSEQTVSHVFETALLSSERTTTTLPKQKLGINRLAASTNDKDSWLTVLIRLATRAPAGLENLVDTHLSANANNGPDSEQKQENALIKPEAPSSSQGAIAPNRIRHQLMEYILDDWRHRLTLAITWLTEEWYADRIQPIGTLTSLSTTTKPSLETPNYTPLTTNLLTRLLPLFDANDHKYLIRFLSEIPALQPEILSLVKALTRDPATVKICIMALQYLYLMRPPVREIVVDTLQEIWTEAEGDAEVRKSTGALLKKWRPFFLEQQEAKKEDQDAPIRQESRTFPNGIKTEEVGNGCDATPGAESDG